RRRRDRCRADTHRDQRALEALIGAYVDPRRGEDFALERCSLLGQSPGWDHRFTFLSSRLRTRSASRWNVSRARRSRDATVPMGIARMEAISAVSRDSISNRTKTV